MSKSIEEEKTFLFAFPRKDLNSIIIDAANLQDAVEKLEDLNIDGDCNWYTIPNGSTIPQKLKNKLIDHWKLVEYGISRLPNVKVN